MAQRSLQWNQPYLSRLMRRKRIHTRDELAKRYPQLSRTSVYRTFDADWGGSPTHVMLAAVADALGIAPRTGYSARRYER